MYVLLSHQERIIFLYSELIEIGTQGVMQPFCKVRVVDQTHQHFLSLSSSDSTLDQMKSGDTF